MDGVTPARLQAKSILVVDDDQDILTVATKGLQNAGFQVHSFSSPTAALQYVKDCSNCELLVSDIRMPEMNGVQLVRKAREFRPEIKTVLMTAFEVKRSELQALLPSTALDDVIRKPFLLSRLIEIIKQLYIEDDKIKTDARPTIAAP